VLSGGGLAALVGRENAETPKSRNAESGGGLAALVRKKGMRMRIRMRMRIKTGVGIGW